MLVVKYNMHSEKSGEIPLYVIVMMIISVTGSPLSGSLWWLAGWGHSYSSPLFSFCTSL